MTMSRTFKNPVPWDDFRSKVHTFNYLKSCQDFQEQMKELDIPCRPRDMKLSNKDYVVSRYSDLHFSHCRG